jgi:hypothetical protein
MNRSKESTQRDFLLDEVEDINFLLETRTEASKFIIRKNERLPAYITHPDFPYMFASLDFISAPGQPAFANTTNISFGQVLDYQFPIECKTIDKDAARSLEFGFPDQYITQLNHQMMLTDSYYGEIAILSGGNRFEIFGYERNDYICKLIEKKNKDFWEQRVLPAREYYAQALADPKSTTTTWD